ncbi:MAG: hypothetical protein R3F37_05710 [Candidatus Competibacteraceae bacterium]
MQKNDNNEPIKRFVRDTLGCTCPDEVLASIALEQGDLRRRDRCCDIRLLVGNRLLIYLLNIDNAANAKDRLPEVLLAGKQDRDDRV